VNRARSRPGLHDSLSSTTITSKASPRKFETLQSRKEHVEVLAALAGRNDHRKNRPLHYGVNSNMLVGFGKGADTMAAGP
jgi:hypothetical protein